MLLAAGKPIIALIATLLILQILYIPVYAQDEEWKTAYSIGKFDYVDPPMPDQIFKIQYRAINGTVDSFRASIAWFSADVDTAGNGTLEIRYPRNYPYTNSNLDQFAPPIFFIDGQEVLLRVDPEVTECFFVFTIPFEENAEIGFAWPFLPTNFPFRGDDVPDYCIAETVVQDVVVKSDGTISPYHQYKAGVRAQDVMCEGGLGPEEYRLVIHPDGRPFCVTRESATDLIQRWGVTIPA